MIKTSMKWGFRLLLLVLIITGVSVFLLMQPTFESRKTLSGMELSSPERLENMVRVLSQDLPRETGQPDLLVKSRDYIYEQLSEHIDAVRFQQYALSANDVFFNVVARIPGSKDCPLVVIGAHYDAYKGYPGADDNASGVAALIELSRLLTQPEVKPLIKCPVELVAYANEEPPYFRTSGMGSYDHAKRLSKSGTEVGVMISLETIGYFSDEADSQHYPIPALGYLYPSQGNFITVVGDMSQMLSVRNTKSAMQSVMDTQVYSINAPVKVPGIDFSDHRNYWEFGYPAVMVTDTAFNRNLNYHTPEDTYEKLDYQRMSDVVNGVLNVVLTQ